MSKREIALNQLSLWFESQKRVLPWRNDPSPYRVWVSEIMLQQTQVITVVPYFEKFMQKFPSVEKLAKASEDEVMFLWAGLGYYSRARNLHQGAKIIVSQGRFPQTRMEWLEIPGVGPYTAGAILSISLNLPEAILDGNVERVLSRFLKVDRSDGDTAYRKTLWKSSEEFVTTGHRLSIAPRVLNQALMELGATVCTPKSPRCGDCPVTKHCLAFKSNDQLNFPPKKAKKAWMHVEEKMYCVMNSSHEVLMSQRTQGAWRAGLWDLLEERPDQILIGRLKKLSEVSTQHVVTRHKIKRQTEVWQIDKARPGFKSRSGSISSDQKFQWVSVDSPQLAIGSAARKTLSAISIQKRGL